MSFKKYATQNRSDFSLKCNYSELNDKIDKYNIDHVHKEGILWGSHSSQLSSASTVGLSCSHALLTFLLILFYNFSAKIAYWTLGEGFSISSTEDFLPYLVTCPSGSVVSARNDLVGEHLSFC